METTKYWIWPAAFLLSLLFIQAPETPKEEMLMSHSTDEHIRNEITVKTIPPRSLHTVSPEERQKQHGLISLEEEV